MDINVCTDRLALAWSHEDKPQGSRGDPHRAAWLVKRAATTPTDELHEPTASSAVSSTARPMLSPLRLTRVGMGSLVYRVE